MAKWIEKILRKPGDNPLKPKVLILAPTGIAANLIHGTTLHTGLGFKFGSRKYLPLKDSRLETFRKSFEELEVIIMDEFSMISVDQLYDVHRRLEEILISKDLFGGKSVILLGDIMQLAPVKGRPIFGKPFGQKNSSLWNSTDNIWKSFEVVSLKVSQRHKEREWKDCLNRIRIGEHKNEDKKLLEGRKLKYFPNINRDDASHVFYTNLEVDTHNRRMLNLQKSDLIHIEAEGMYPKGYRLLVKPHGTIEDTSFLKDFYVKKGARVMLTFNVNIADSLVNGSLGTVIDFIWEKSKVKAIIIVFDNPDAGQQHRKNNHQDSVLYEKQNGVPIYKLSLEHLLKGSTRSTKSHGARGTTCQFPLRLAWASTCHRLQGVTIQEGSNLIAHGHANIPRNMFYVMFSRCSSLENLYLDDKVDLDSIFCEQRALEEKNRLDHESLTEKIKDEEADLFYINIRSFKKHEEDLMVDLCAKRATYLCLVETWIKPDTNAVSPFQDKSLHHASYGDGKGCCVIVPKTNELISKEVTETFQLISFKLLEKYQVIVLYMSKEANKKEVKESLKRMFMPSMEQIVIGDFNFDSQKRNEVSGFLEKSCLKQLVKQPTHWAGRTLDHVYVPEGLINLIELKIVFKYYSDHAALQIKFKM